MSVGDVKSELRQFVRLTRAARSADELDVAQTAFGIALTTLISEEQWGRVAAFIPTPSEPPILGVLESLVAEGVDVTVPVSTPNGLLEWIRVERGFVDDMTKDAMGMPIPTSGERVHLESTDVVLVPAAAVDRHGNRLGWGKGYYDRFLKTLDPDTFVVAVVFDSDVLMEIPTEPHDVGVDIIVTERDIYTIQ